MPKLLKALVGIRVNFKREKLLMIANIAVMTVTFVILGIFITLIVLSRTGLRYLENQAQITVFFKDDFPETAMLTMQKELEADSRISTVRYVSKKEAFKIFSEMNKDQPVLLDSINESVLPASLEIRTKHLSDLAEFSNTLSARDGVEEVKFFKDVIERFKTWTTIIYSVGLFLTLLFIFISFSVIVVTLRLTIHSKGTELEVMKLVGATDKYIKSPLVYQGIFIGLVSSIISSLVIFVLFFALSLLKVFTADTALYVLPGMLLSPLLFAVLLSLITVFSGCLLGYLGSLVALRKYLKY